MCCQTNVVKVYRVWKVTFVKFGRFMKSGIETDGLRAFPPKPDEGWKRKLVRIGVNGRCPANLAESGFGAPAQCQGVRADDDVLIFIDETLATGDDLDKT